MVNIGKKSRIGWIDIVKGLAMAGVIFGHLSQRSQISRIIVYSFHMPLFLIISGYLYKKKYDISDEIKKLLSPR